MEPRVRLRAAVPALALLITAAAASGPGGGEVERLAGPAPGGVTGRIFTPEGRPAVEVPVTLHRGTRTWSVRTDQEGAYCFCPLPPGRDYRLAVQAEGFAGWEERDLVVSRNRLAVRNVILRPSSDFLPPGKEPE